MDKAGQPTLSATEFARVTGVGRERLRTWERRHDFPVPRRAEGGRRRYALADVPRAIAVRTALDQGTPLAAAIAQVGETPSGPGLSLGSDLTEHLPLPLVAVSGPRPMRFEYLNTTARMRDAAPGAGDLVLDRAPWFSDSPGYEVLSRVFAGRSVAAACEHPDWSGVAGRTMRSIAFRLPQHAGASPLLALLGIETEGERGSRQELASLRAEHETLSERARSQGRWLDAMATVVEHQRDGSGAEVLRETAATLVRQLGALDVAIAPYMAGQIVLGRSSRGLLGPEMVTVAAYDDLGAVLRETAPAWLEPSTAAAFGAPKGSETFAVPVVTAGELLGVVLVLLDERTRLGVDPSRMLLVAATAIGFALLRERVVGQLRDAAP